MKSYKEFIKESKTDIHSICKKYGINDYTINPDGSIDVDGNVNLSDNELTKLPLKFRNVSGYFSCEYNQLTSLEGCPQSVGRDFSCSGNKLTSLEGGPQSVGRDFRCSLNELTTLEGCPQSVGGDFYCRSNKLINFNGFPEDFEGNLYLDDNPLEEVYNLFRKVKCIKWLNEFDVIQGDKVILDRLEEVYHQMGMDIPDNIKLKNYEII